MILIRYT